MNAELHDSGFSFGRGNKMLGCMIPASPLVEVNVEDDSGFSSKYR
jgi:hypothetical protein